MISRIVWGLGSLLFPLNCKLCTSDASICEQCNDDFTGNSGKFSTECISNKNHPGCMEG